MTVVALYQSALTMCGTQEAAAPPHKEACFLSLPSEIRQQIYGYLLDAKKLDFELETYHKAILVVSKVIQEEASLFFRVTNLFTRLAFSNAASAGRSPPFTHSCVGELFTNPIRASTLKVSIRSYNGPALHAVEIDVLDRALSDREFNFQRSQSSSDHVLDSENKSPSSHESTSIWPYQSLLDTDDTSSDSSAGGRENTNVPGTTTERRQTTRCSRLNVLEAGFFWLVPISELSELMRHWRWIATDPSRPMFWGRYEIRLKLFNTLSYSLKRIKELTLEPWRELYHMEYFDVDSTLIGENYSRDLAMEVTFPVEPPIWLNDLLSVKKSLDQSFVRIPSSWDFKRSEGPLEISFLEFPQKQPGRSAENIERRQILDNIINSYDRMRRRIAYEYSRNGVLLTARDIGEAFHQQVSRLLFQCTLNMSIAYAQLDQALSFDTMLWQPMEWANHAVATCNGETGRFILFHESIFVPKNNPGWYSNVEKANAYYTRSCVMLKSGRSTATILQDLARADSLQPEIPAVANMRYLCKHRARTHAW